MTDILQLTDTWRISYGQDMDAENPRTSGDHILTGALCVNDRRSVATVHEFPGDLPYVIRRIHENYNVWSQTAEVVIRWARICYDMRLHFDGDVFWWVDRAALIEAFGEEAAASVLEGTYYTDDDANELITEQTIIDQDAETYRQWVDGEVIQFTIEQAITYQREPSAPKGGPELITVWEEHESLAGVYLDSKLADEEMEVALAVAEQLDLPDQAASQALRLAAGLTG